MNILLSSWLLFLFPQLILGQETIPISYGEKIEIGKIGEKYNYRIEYSNTSKTLTHSEINNYVFEKPGIYKIYTQEVITEKYFGKKIFSEELLPIPKSFFVNVDSIIMNFQPLSIRVDKTLKQNESVDNMILSIDCEIKNYYNNPIAFENKRLKVEAAGIGAAVKGELVDISSNIQSGLHTLRYKLSGIFSEKAHIQFDFELYNGKISPISYHETIK